MTAAPLVVCEHCSVTLAGRKALDNISFRLDHGQTWLVLGPNGSGKSTLMRLLRADIWPDDDGVGCRTYFPDDGPGRQSPIGLKHRFGLVSPELARSMKRLGEHITAETCILAGARDTLYVQGRPTSEESHRLVEILDRLELTALAASPLGILSNGQLRAVLLARALMRRPLALFLDEFLDGLDTQAMDLAGWAVGEAAKTGVAVVVTSHRPAQLPVEAAMGVRVEDGHLVATGPAEDILALYAAGQKRRAPARTAAPAPEPARNASRKPATPLIVLEKATVVLGERTILDNLSLSVHPGDHMAILGANGAGKSTLLKLIAGEYHPALGGRVSRPGLAAPEGLTDLRDIRRRIGIVSFELEAAYAKHLSARDLVLSGIGATIGLLETPGDQDRAAADYWMAVFDVADLAERQLGELSAGQTRRLFLARAMVARPRLLLLDEPFAGLDAASRYAAMGAVSAVAALGVTVLAAVHIPSDIIPEIQTIYRLENGHLLPSSAAALQQAPA